MDTTPNRLVDYFCVVGLPDSSNFIGLDLSQMTAATILDRWPRRDHLDSPMPAMVPIFCFPGGVDVRWRDDSERRPVMFTFALTDDGGRRSHGNALMFYEARTRRVESEGSLEVETEQVHVPKVLCALSHWPFHPVYKLFLRHLYVRDVTLPNGVRIEKSA